MDFPLPPVGEGLYEVELVRWLVRPGDAVSAGQGLAEVLSDKATMEVPAPFAGTVTALSGTPGTKIAVGQLLLTYTPADGIESALGGRNASVHGATITQPTRALVTANGSRSSGPTTQLLPPAAPSVRMLARKLGIDLAAIHGTGPHGRILLDDLTPFLKPRSANDKPAKPEKPDMPKFDYGTPGTTVKLLGVRRKIAEHMVTAMREIPHYSYIDECDLTDLVRMRSQLRDSFSKGGVKLTYLAFFVKAAARALKEVPIVNSTYDPATTEIRLLDRYNIGVAVATPGGLIVPVVKDADMKDVAAIAGEIERLSSDAKSGHSRLEDLKGGTFTVTSIGNVGGMISTPIINHPEVGIMGVGKVVKRPVYDAHGAIRPADILYLSFSFDHRIVDGAVGAAFGNAVLRQLQNPALLLLPEKFGG